MSVGPWWEPYDARAITECLDDWASDARYRRAASDALAEMCTAARARGNAEDDPALVHMESLRTALVSFHFPRTFFVIWSFSFLSFWQENRAFVPTPKVNI